jgi:hypothetical protein
MKSLASYITEDAIYITEDAICITRMRPSRIGLLVAAVFILIVAFKLMVPDFDIFRRDCMVTSAVDHESYIVEDVYENKQRAADILAEINQMYVRVITHLKRNRIAGPWNKEISYLAANYDPTVLGEHIPTNLKYTSYVAQKGKKIRLCLRTIENRNEFHDMQTLRFVALHELTHMAVQSYGHDDHFWDTFRFILREAADLGEIKLIDYSKRPQPYCGIMIESSPAF